MIENNYCVYLHRNMYNNKVYIGQTRKTPNERWGKNGGGYKKQSYFFKAIKKYGWDNFEHIMLLTNLTLEEANKKEKELISFYHSNDSKYGYNIRSGGGNLKKEDNPNYNNHKLTGGNNPSAKKILQYTLDGTFVASYPSSTEACQALGLSKKSSSILRNCKQDYGNSFGFIWVHEGEEYRLEKKIANAIYHPPKGEENKCHGRKISQSHKDAISKKVRGGLNPSAKQVKQLTLDGELIKIWSCATEAARYFNGSNSTISRCAQGRGKTAYGYKWEYIKKEKNV